MSSRNVKTRLITETNRSHIERSRDALYAGWVQFFPTSSGLELTEFLLLWQVEAGLELTVVVWARTAMYYNLEGQIN